MSSIEVTAGGEGVGITPGSAGLPEIQVTCRDGEVVGLGFGRSAPGAGTAGDAELAREVREQVYAGIREGRTVPEFPLSLSGTGFDLLVWGAIRGIPFGETVSYGDLARRIGRPGSQRAVARACGRNRIAVLIPCHRVVVADGSPGGYRWGTEVKRLLLATEGRVSTG